jgi:hypothetical protein
MSPKVFIKKKTLPTSPPGDFAFPEKNNWNIWNPPPTALIDYRFTW